MIEVITKDHKALSMPNFAPFKDKEDVVNRLLPYHTLQFPAYPKDLKVLTAEEKEETIRKAQRIMDKINNVVNERSQRVVICFVIDSSCLIK
jgi:hypothetical protein